MSIQSDLQYFYDHEAKKYAETRQKFWHESTRIVNILEEILAKKES